MRLTRENGVYQVLLDHPETAWVFHRFGIGFEPDRSLEQAAEEAGTTPDKLIGELERAIRQEHVLSQRDWSQACLAELTEYVQKRYHVYLRYELPRLRRLLSTLLEPALPEALQGLLAVVDSLYEEMTAHLDAEENVLFRHLESRSRGSGPAPEAEAESSAFRQMQREHERVERSLNDLRRLTRDYSLLERAADAIGALHRELRGLEPQLREHIRLENEFLWPSGRDRPAAADEADRSSDNICPRTGRPCPFGDPAVCRRFWECVGEALGVAH